MFAQSIAGNHDVIKPTDYVGVEGAYCSLDNSRKRGGKNRETGTCSCERKQLFFAASKGRYNSV